jgi:hypothetical protein
LGEKKEKKRKEKEGKRVTRSLHLQNSRLVLDFTLFSARGLQGGRGRVEMESVRSTIGGRKN